MANPSWCSKTGTTYIAPDRLNNRAHETGSNFSCLKGRYEVLVSRVCPVCRRSRCDDYILPNPAVLVPRIPFTAERRNGVNAPVDENSELCVSVPARNFVGLQRIANQSPKWPLLDRVIYPLEHFVALRIVLATCLSPDLIDGSGFSDWVGESSRVPSNAPDEYKARSPRSTERETNFANLRTIATSGENI